jgi:phage terminase small subunit
MEKTEKRSGGVQPKHHAPKTRIASVLRRQKLLQAVIEGRSIIQAAIETGISPKTADSQAGAILREPKVQETFLALLNKTIPDNILTNKYNEIMFADKIIHFNPETGERVTAPDYATQLRSADSVAKLKGHMIEKKEVSGPEGGPIRLTEVTDEELLNLARRGGSGTAKTS